MTELKVEYNKSIYGLSDIADVISKIPDKVSLAKHLSLNPDALSAPRLEQTIKKLITEDQIDSFFEYAHTNYPSFLGQQKTVNITVMGDMNLGPSIKDSVLQRSQIGYSNGPVSRTIYPNRDRGQQSPQGNNLLEQYEETKQMLESDLAIYAPGEAPVHLRRQLAEVERKIAELTGSS